MANSQILMCSFYTEDPYYSGHAMELRRQLESLSIEHEIAKVTRSSDEDWADITRRKISFIHQMCEKHPQKRIFWIDVDCRISHLPSYVSESTADLIGFQRSFGSPLQIGYANRARFWEPSFWGVGTSNQARKFVSDALALESRSGLKATDDYFLEEAWRANSKSLTFQMIPSSAIIKRSNIVSDHSRLPFFQFGSSGNVTEFKHKVVQHGSPKGRGLRKSLLRRAKKLERALPAGIRKPLRRSADSLGITNLLTAGKLKSVDPERNRLIGTIQGTGILGDETRFEVALKQFQDRYIPTLGEAAIIEASESFLYYSRGNSEKLIHLSWWAKPFPGNFGDWLSPLIISHYSKTKLVIQPPTRPTRRKHLIGVGSIGRFIQSSAVVIGTGISTDDVRLSRKATYVSVRGPLTAKALAESKGPEVTQFGDPGIVISKIFPVKRSETNGRGVLVRHFSHGTANLKLPSTIDELSVKMSRPEDIKKFVQKLNEYDYVITSAMHVMITCHSYGIPCALVTFEEYEGSVHGSGIKYEDYAMGADVEVLSPVVLPTDLRRTNLRRLAKTVKVSDKKIKEVEGHIRQAITMVLK